MFKALLDPAEPKAGRANFRLGSFTTVSVFMFWLFCPLGVNRCGAIQPPGRPLSVVSQIADGARAVGRPPCIFITPRVLPISQLLGGSLQWRRCRGGHSDALFASSRGADI